MHINTCELTTDVCLHTYACTASQLRILPGKKKQRKYLEVKD